MCPELPSISEYWKKRNKLLNTRDTSKGWEEKKDNETSKKKEVVEQPGEIYFDGNRKRQLKRIRLNQPTMRSTKKS